MLEGEQNMLEDYEVLAHTSFLGHTGYANHSRNFFTALNKLMRTRIRNFAIDKDVNSYLTGEQNKMLIRQAWNQPPWKVGSEFKFNNSSLINIVLNEVNHYFFYDFFYDGGVERIAEHLGATKQDVIEKVIAAPKVAYNVWESTRQPEDFFKLLLQYDQLWVPTKWQRDCTVEQGYPKNRIRVVPEAVDGEKFYPLDEKTKKDVKTKLLTAYNIPEDAFIFTIFGRWDYRKSTAEMINAFLKVFSNKEDSVYLVISVDNPFPADGLNSTEERLRKHGFNSNKIKILHFPPDDEYVKWLQTADVFLSCSRSEGWNLPLMEAIACGIPTICSDYGAQLEFADNTSIKVSIKDFLPPEQVFSFRDSTVPGVWAEPDFEDLKRAIRYSYDNHKGCKEKALQESEVIRKKFTWEEAANKAFKNLQDLQDLTYDSKEKVTDIGLGDVKTVNDRTNIITASYDEGGNPKIDISGELETEYWVFFHADYDEHMYFSDIVNVNRFVAMFVSAAEEEGQNFVRGCVVSEHGFIARFKFNINDKTIEKILPEPVNFKTIPPPVIICGSIGGGTSYITKMLRFCGLEAGDAGDINKRKSHESVFCRNASDIVSRMGQNDFLHIWADENISKIRNKVKDNFDKYVKAFRRITTDWYKVLFDSKVWGFKAPDLSLKLPIWLEVFPDAKILCVQRDKNVPGVITSDTGDWFYNSDQDFARQSLLNPDVTPKLLSFEDRKFLREAHKEYVGAVSNRSMAISLQLANYLLYVCLERKPLKIFERGSGFSTFVFSYYKHIMEDKGFDRIRIVSYETSDVWKKETCNYLTYNGFDIPEFGTLKGNEKADLVFEDTDIDVRRDGIGEVITKVNKDGIVIFDDVHTHDYLKDYLIRSNMYYYSLKRFTFDEFGRYACMGSYKQLDTLVKPPESVKYPNFEDITTSYEYFDDILDWVGLPKIGKDGFERLLKDTNYEKPDGESTNKDDEVVSNVSTEDDVIIISSYTDSKEKLIALENCITSLKKTGLEIILTAHYPVSTKIQNMVDYYVYDRYNTILDESVYFWIDDEKFFFRSNNFRLSSKSFASATAARNGIQLAHNLGKKFFYFFEYDSTIHEDDISKLLNLKKRIYDRGKKGYIQIIKGNTVRFRNANEGNLSGSMSMVFFAFDTKFFMSIFTFPYDTEKYKEVVGEEIGTEWYFFHNVKYHINDLLVDIHDTSIPVLFENSQDKLAQCPDSIHTKHYIDIVPEEDTGKPVLFISVQDISKGMYEIWFRSTGDEEVKEELLEIKCKGQWYYNKLADNVDSVRVDYYSYEHSEDFEVVYEADVEKEVKEKHGIFRSKEKNKTLKDKKILIELDSKSLGDTLAWFPCAEEFAKQNNCVVATSTFWNQLFDFEKYPHIVEHVDPGGVVHNIHGHVKLGYYYDMEPDPRTLGLQQIASSMLGIEHKEIKPIIKVPDYESTIEKPYVCISIHSTAQCKYWNNPVGWKRIVDSLQTLGFNVVLVDKYRDYMGNKAPRNVNYNVINKPIEQVVALLNNSEFVMTISNGIAWLAWALNKKVVLISGFTKPFNEFDCIRVHRSDVCHGCMNDTRFKFDRGDWYWCPMRKNFECSRKITPNQVLEDMKNEGLVE